MHSFICQKAIPNRLPPSGQRRGHPVATITGGQKVQVAICGNLFERK